MKNEEYNLKEKNEGKKKRQNREIKENDKPKKGRIETIKKNMEELEIGNQSWPIWNTAAGPAEIVNEILTTLK